MVILWLVIDVDVVVVVTFNGSLNSMFYLWQVQIKAYVKQNECFIESTTASSNASLFAKGN